MLLLMSLAEITAQVYHQSLTWHDTRSLRITSDGMGVQPGLQYNWCNTGIFKVSGCFLSRTVQFMVKSMLLQLWQWYCCCSPWPTLKMHSIAGDISLGMDNHYINSVTCQFTNGFEGKLWAFPWFTWGHVNKVLLLEGNETFSKAMDL